MRRPCVGHPNRAAFFPTEQTPVRRKTRPGAVNVEHAGDLNGEGADPMGDQKAPSWASHHLGRQAISPSPHGPRPGSGACLCAHR